MGWLHTGLPVPAFSLTTMNVAKNQEEPFGLLAEPSWLNAHLAYLRDMEFFEQRQSAAAQGRASGSSARPAPASTAAAAAAAAKARPKKRPTAKSRPQPPAAGGAAGG